MGTMGIGIEIGKANKLHREGLAVVSSVIAAIFCIYLMYPGSLRGLLTSSVAMSFTIMAIYLFDKLILGSMLCFMLSELVYLMNSGDILQLLLVWSGVLIAAIRIIYKVRWTNDFRKASILEKIDQVIYHKTGGIKLTGFYTFVIVALIGISLYSVSSNTAEGQGAMIQLLQIISVYLPTMLIILTMLNLKLSMYIRLFTYSLIMTMGIIIAVTTGDRTNAIGSSEYLLLTSFTLYVLWRDQYIKEIRYKSDKEQYLEVMGE